MASRRIALFIYYGLLLCAPGLVIADSENSFQSSISSPDYDEPLDREAVQLELKPSEVLRLLSKKSIQFSFLDEKENDREPRIGDIALRKISSIVAEVIAEFFKGSVASSGGVEYPNSNSAFPAQFLKRINNSKFKVMLQGMTDLKYLSGPFYYSELQGGPGFEYDFYSKGKDGDEEALVAIRWTPAYGEVAWIRTDVGARRVTGLPSVATIGTSVGFEAFHWLNNWFQMGATAYIRPQQSLEADVPPHATYFEQIYVRVLLNSQDRYTSAPVLRLSTYLSYFNRGKQGTQVAKWMNEALSERNRNYSDVDDSIEGMMFFEVLFK